MANFSSRKNPSKPASNVANNACGSAFDSNASGNACKSDVDSMIPTDRLTMRSTIFDSRPNEKIAAAEMLNTPAMVVANRMGARVELILCLGSDEFRCKLEHGDWIWANKTVTRGKVDRSPYHAAFTFFCAGAANPDLP